MKRIEAIIRPERVEEVKIFVSPVEEAIRIRTGEVGAATL